MGKFAHIIKEEVLSVIPAMIFFMISFNLIVLTEKLMMGRSATGYMSYMAATLGAIAVAKLILLANLLPFINIFPKKPLIYNIVWKFILFAFLVLLFRVTERMIEFSYDLDNMSLAYDHVDQMIHSPIFWAIQLWLLMLFIVYIVASEFIARLGKEEIKSLLFGPRLD